MVPTLQKLWANSGIRYLVVAGSVAIFYLSLVTLGITLGFHYLVSILIAQFLAILIGFPLYRYFVFESKGNSRNDFVKFLTVWSGGAFSGLALTPFLVEFFHWDPVLSQILAIFIISILSYLAHRFFTFRDR